jgi:pentose-5-phosphate-3-epimerase
MKNKVIRARCMNVHIACGGNKFIPDFDTHISKGENHIGEHDVDGGITLIVMLYIYISVG